VFFGSGWRGGVNGGGRGGAVVSGTYMYFCSSVRVERWEWGWGATYLVRIHCSHIIHSAHI